MTKVVVLFHPGPPYFHDAYKIWNCCKHNDEKPADIVKIAAVKEIRPEKEEDVIVWKGLNKPAERKAEAERKEVALRVEATEGARLAVEKHNLETSELGTSSSLRVGAPCRNNGCEKSYDGTNDEETCQFHPGQAIFHEGMKFWSCCERKTSNFNAFLEQTGCQKGEHKWSLNEVVNKVREDWFSSNGDITFNIYCRGSLPDKVKVLTDGQLLRAHIPHGFGNKETDIVFELWGEIIPEESRVLVGERKVEVVLKQKDAVGWPRLRFDPDIDVKESTEA
ncbi:unnamed protein product [Caenorhabditis auriculariae]|uniref:CS domain-containing protein n=1 Tax=Caenorhabditis auriculariae TaxID=2777116 RepID=A0A8S1HI26_9PELO|nr:unnamed protein product [Caenorhabditis auriculariae]